MQNLLTMLFRILLLLASFNLYGDDSILRVIDGDTVVISAPYLPKPLKPELSLRIWGVDTPEKGTRSKCLEEDKSSIRATKFTKKFIGSGKKIQISIVKWDKYGGRVLGDVLVDGKSLRSELISKGFGREYYGDAKKSWCSI